MHATLDGPELLAMSVPLVLIIVIIMEDVIAHNNANASSDGRVNSVILRIQIALTDA